MCFHGIELSCCLLHDRLLARESSWSTLRTEILALSQCSSRTTLTSCSIYTPDCRHRGGDPQYTHPIVLFIAASRQLGAIDESHGIPNLPRVPEVL